MSEFKSHIAVKTGSERSFGVVFAIVFALIGLYPLLDGGSPRLWAIVVAVALLALAFLAPKTLSPPNRLWFRLGIALGAIVAPIVMILVYVIAVVPVGLVMRLVGKDPLRQKMDKKARSYWIAREEPVGTMRNQF